MQDLAALEVPIQGMPSNMLLDNLQAKNQPEPKEVGTLF